MKRKASAEVKLSNLLVFFLVVQLLSCEEEVVLIVEITRHGARASFSSEQLGKAISKGDLTPIGMRQHYLLGKEVSSRYPTIFSGKLSMDQYYVRSTGTHRTITSAICHLMGLWDHFDQTELTFENGDKRTLPPSIQDAAGYTDFKTPLPKGFIPSPVHSETVEEDDLLFMMSSNLCPRGKKDSIKFRTNLGLELEKSDRLKQVVQEVSKKIGYLMREDYSTYENCILIGDFVLQDLKNNPAPALQESDPLFKIVSRCYETSIMSKYSIQNVLIASSATLIEEILGKIIHRVDNPSSKLKYFLYSTHDSTLAPLLILADYLDLDCFMRDMKEVKYTESCRKFPETASNIIFEVTKDSKDHFVRLMYNFEPIDFCRLENRDGGYKCEVKVFEKEWKKKIDLDFKQYCEYPSNNSWASAFSQNNKKRVNRSDMQFWKVSAILVLGILSVLLLFIISRLYKEYKVRSSRKKNKDSSNSTDNDNSIII